MQNYTAPIPNSVNSQHL